MLNLFIPDVGCVQLIWQYSLPKEQASLNKEELVLQATLLPLWKQDIKKRIEAINGLCHKIAALDYAVTKSKYNDKRSFSLICGNLDSPWTFSLGNIQHSLLVKERITNCKSYTQLRRQLLQGMKNLQVSAALALRALPQRIIRLIPPDNALRRFSEQNHMFEMAIDVDQNQSNGNADYLVCTLFFPVPNKSNYRYATTKQITVQIPKRYLQLCLEGEVLTLRQDGCPPVLAKINQHRWRQELNSPWPFQTALKPLLKP